METHEFTRSFEMDGLILSPTHVRIEQLSPIIAAHRHSNSSYEIHYTAHGRGRVLIGEAAYAVEPRARYTSRGRTFCTRSFRTRWIRWSNTACI